MIVAVMLVSCRSSNQERLAIRRKIPGKIPLGNTPKKYPGKIPRKTNPGKYPCGKYPRIEEQSKINTFAKLGYIMEHIK